MILRRSASIVSTALIAISFAAFINAEFIFPISNDDDFGEITIEDVDDRSHENRTVSPNGKDENHETVKNRQRRVVNGVEAGEDDWKFMVAILKQHDYGNLQSRNTVLKSNRNKHFWQACGGTLIHPRFVLTAGHCVVDGRNEIISPNTMIVRAGAHYLSSGSNDPYVDDIDVLRIYIRDRFDTNNLQNGFDLALLELVRPAHHYSSIFTANLPPFRMSYPTGTECYSAGWGRTELGTNSDKAMVVTVPIYDYDECASIWHFPAQSNDGKLICALSPSGGTVQDTCYGDSGGPLICKLPTNRKSIHASDRWVLAGVVSYGNNVCGTAGVPGVYTSVSYFRSWIDSIILNSKK